MTIVKIFAVGVLIVTFSNFTLTSKAVEIRQNAIDIELENFEIDEPSLTQALSRLSNEFGARIGMEFSAESPTKAVHIALKAKSISLRDAISGVISQDPRYRVEFIGELSNVYPVTSDPVIEELLATRIPSFAMDENFTRLRIRKELNNVPAIKLKLDSAKLTANDIAFTGHDFGKPGSGFILLSADKSLRELLNEIIKSDLIRFWIVNRTGEKREYFVINF